MKRRIIFNKAKESSIYGEKERFYDEKDYIEYKKKSIRTRASFYNGDNI